MVYPEPESELQESSSSELSVLDNVSSTDSNKWEELLRKMLPAGAPVPDEDHLDYSITVDYQGPPPCLNSSVSGSISKPPKFTSSYKTRHALLISRKNDSLGERVRLDHVNFDEEPKNSASCSSVFFDFPVVNFDDNVEVHAVNCDDEVEDENSRKLSVNLCSNDGVDGMKSRNKVKVCSRCREGGRFITMGDRREACIVCGAEYCKKCVLKGMGSMPEGRKCVACIGRPINEANRGRLGKSSRLLERVCSDLEVRQILKAEKECMANQIRPDQVVVNGRPLRKEELVDVLGCGNPPCNLRPGRYWYDEDSGLWGQEGEKPDRFISAKLNVGGKLLVNASNGNTKVYINGREITKLELRILKLANVQSPRDTHFWVYEDGSYEEEGQNNIKGNIWGKASTRLICSLFSLPVPPRNVDGRKEDPTGFSGRPMPEHIEQGKVQKLLLLGLEGSGSSTIFKQARFIYGYKFTAQELQDIKLLTQSNIYIYLDVLLEGREHFEDEALLAGKAHDLTAEKSAQGSILLDGRRQCVYSIKKRFKNFSDWLLDIMSSGDFDTFFPAAAHEYASILDEVWKDPAIQATYKRMKDRHGIPDFVKYFLDRAIEISSNEYQPSEEDILYAEGITSNNGLASFEFSSDDHSPMSERYHDDLEVHPPLTNYQLIRINAKGWHDGCKWLEMFEGFRAVIFCVSLIDYDQVQEHDNGSLSNKMLACRNLFESLVSHPSFENTPFVLILNKYDAFEEKINLVPLTVCEWFTDFSPIKHHHNSHSVAPQAYFYIAVKFKMLYTSITGKKLFVWKTRGHHRSSVNEAFKYIIEVIKWDEEIRNMYIIYDDDDDDDDDDSFHSPERTSSPNNIGQS